MDDHKLETVTKERDLGVCISETLKPMIECQQAYVWQLFIFIS